MMWVLASLLLKLGCFLFCFSRRLLRSLRYVYYCYMGVGVDQAWGSAMRCGVEQG